MSTPVNSPLSVQSRNVHSCEFTSQCPVVQCPVLWIHLSMSSPTMSTPVNSSLNVQSHNVHPCEFTSQCPVVQCPLLWIHLSVSSRYVRKSLTSSLKLLGSSLKSLRASRRPSLESIRSSLKSSHKSFTSCLKSLPTLSCLPCLGHSFTNYVMLICIIWTHPTHVMYYGKWWRFGDITKLTQYYHLLFWKFRFLRLTEYIPRVFILGLYEHKGPTKLLRLNVNCCLKCTHQQIISLKIRCIDIFVKVAKKVGRVYGNVVYQCCTKCTLSIIHSSILIMVTAVLHSSLTVKRPYTLECALKCN